MALEGVELSFIEILMQMVNDLLSVLLQYQISYIGKFDLIIFQVTFSSVVSLIDFNGNKLIKARFYM